MWIIFCSGSRYNFRFPRIHKSFEFKLTYRRKRTSIINTYWAQPYLLVDGLPPVVHDSKKHPLTVRQPMVDFPRGWITRDENTATWGFSLKHLRKQCPFKFVYNSYKFWIHQHTCPLTTYSLWRLVKSERKFFYLSGFAKRYLQDHLATVSFEACSVLDQYKKPLTSCSRQKKKRVYSAVYIFPHPLPLPYLSFLKLLSVSLSTITFEISARGRSYFPWSGSFSRFLSGHLQQSFPEGIIKTYEGTSLTIGKVCRRTICYRILSHFG